MKKTILTIISTACFVIALLFGIDREVARMDYNDGNDVTGCIFSTNCDRYND